MDLHLHIDDRILATARRLVANPKMLAGLTVTGLLLGATGVAAVPHVFTSGSVISSTEMNANFAALDEAIANLQADAGVFTNPTTGEVYSERNGVCGQTAPTNGNLGGLDGAKDLCESTCGSPGAHMCSVAEVLRDVATGSSLPTGKPWVNSGVPNIGTDADLLLRDCLRWGNTSDAGTILDIYPLDADNPGGPTPEFANVACNTTHPVLCCD